MIELKCTQCNVFLECDLSDFYCPDCKQNTLTNDMTDRLKRLTDGVTKINTKLQFIIDSCDIGQEEAEEPEAESTVH